jgi:hypothetical protein
MARTVAYNCDFDPHWIRIQMGQLTRIRIGNPDLGRPKLFHKKEKIKEVKKLKKTFQTVYKQKKYFDIEKLGLDLDPYWVPDSATNSLDPDSEIPDRKGSHKSAKFLFTKPKAHIYNLRLDGVEGC